jgi:hypothetical protein
MLEPKEVMRKMKERPKMVERRGSIEEVGGGGVQKKREGRGEVIL